MWLGDQRQVQAVLSGEITPRSGTGSWLGTIAVLDGYGENIYFFPPTEFDPRTVQPLASYYTDYAIQLLVQRRN